MGSEVKVSDTTADLMSGFLRRHDIRSLTVMKGEGITRNTEISDITMQLIKEKDRPELDYSVEFKLQRECADINRYLQAIHTSPEFAIELAADAEKIEAAEVDRKLKSFIETIRERVKSALKEQTVQNISYVGNTFILNNSIKFRVLSDEGEGRLNIELLTNDKPLDALLTASGLLDGLYLGSIKLIDSK